MNNIRDILDVSLVIPIYNGEKFLDKTLESIKNQKSLFKELILVNDNSSDKSEKIIYDFFAKYKCNFDVKIVRHNNNLGASYSYTHGALISKSKYILFFDQDDIAFPDMVDSLYNAIEIQRKINKRYVVAVGGVIEIDEHDNIINNIPIVGENFPPDEFLPHLIVRNRGCRTGGMIVDSNVFKDAGGFSSNIKSAMDWELCVRLAVNGYLAYFLDKPLLFYRRHNKNITGNIDIGIEDTITIYKNIGIGNVVNIIINGFSDKCDALYHYMMMFSLHGLNEKEFKVACKKSMDYYGKCQNHKDFLFLLSVCALKEKNIELAHEILNKVLFIDENHASALNNLGCIEALLGNKTNAINLLSKALKLYPNYVDAGKNIEILNREKNSIDFNAYFFTYRPLRKRLTTYLR